MKTWKRKIFFMVQAGIFLAYSEVDKLNIYYIPCRV